MRSSAPLTSGVLDSGKVLEAEESIPHDDGLHTYFVIKSPLCDAEGKPYAVCSIGTDITEWKRLQADLTRANRVSSMGRAECPPWHTRSVNRLPPLSPTPILVCCGYRAMNRIWRRRARLCQESCKTEGVQARLSSGSTCSSSRIPRNGSWSTSTRLSERWWFSCTASQFNTEYQFRRNSLQTFLRSWEIACNCNRC